MPLRRLTAARSLVIVAGLQFLALSALAAAPPAAPRAAPRLRNVIFLIPDGMGPAAVTLLREYEGRPTHLDSLLVGVCRTYSADSKVTDSAAAVTALACGIKTNNRMIGLDPAGRPVANLLEAAQSRGLATGLVVTSRITHATPAGFAAHVPERNQEEQIAAQMLEHRIDVLLGGGREYFLPRSAGGKRLDDRNLVSAARAQGYQYVATAAELRGPLRRPLLGLFDDDHMTYEADRDPAAEPSLAEMTGKTLDLLATDPDGFFVMIEGSRIDHAEHDDDAGATRYEMQAFDAAVGAAVSFARRDGQTLVVATADHETGGLSLGRLRSGNSLYAYYPEVLRGVRASGWKMVQAIRTGASGDSVLRVWAGLDSLGDADRTLLAEGIAGDDVSLDHNLNEIVSRRALIGWTTYGHTGIDVGLYAFGPGAELFRGVHDNTDVAGLIAGLMGFDLAGLTAKLRAR